MACPLTVLVQHCKNSFVLFTCLLCEIAHEHMSRGCGDAGHHIIRAANSFLAHLMLWHVTWQC